MWADVETDVDFLNFKVLAGLVGQMVLEAKGKPLSIGISGGWGVGKSSMVKLVEKELRAASSKDMVFLTFNAWLYQGVDDTKAALMEEISAVLSKRAEGNETVLKKIVEFAKRVNIFRLGRLGVEAAASVHLGFPVGLVTNSVQSLIEGLSSQEVSDDVSDVTKFAKDHKEDAKGLLRPKKGPETPPQVVHALRRHFEEILDDLKVTLVVFVDDLDRCLPPTVIGTLEAMRLFLFLQNTAFVIAADDRMIKEAVRLHFKDARLDDDLVTNYFDKLIQVPLRVPPLGVNEVRAYLCLLFVEACTLDQAIKDKVYAGVNERLTRSWTGESVSAEFVASLIPSCPVSLKAEFAMADRLAKQMATSRRIAGNPRLVKRFLNTLSIRSKLAKLQNIPIDDAVLAKILLFERCAAPSSFDGLVQSVNQGHGGVSENLAVLEEQVRSGKELPSEGIEFSSADKAFVVEWLKLDPPLGEVDLRGALHVGRESLPLVVADDRISKAARDLLAVLLTSRVRPQASARDGFAALGPDERAYVTDKLLEKASSEKTWGTPDVLWGLSTAAESDKELAKKIVVFFASLESTTLAPSIVPRIRGSDWGKEVLSEWRARDDLPDPVRSMLDSSAKTAH